MIAAAGGAVLALPADVSCGGDMERAVAERFGPPTVLVHNAAIKPSGTIDKMKMRA